MGQAMRAAAHPHRPAPESGTCPAVLAQEIIDSLTSRHVENLTDGVVGWGTGTSGAGTVCADPSEHPFLQ